MPMLTPSYRASLSIGASAASVWRTLSDVEAWPEWLAPVTSVRALDSARVRIGSRYEVVQPRLRPSTWSVTEIEPEHRFVWQSRSPGLLMTADHIVEELATDQSIVTLQFSFSRIWGTPIGLLFRSITEQYLAQEIA